MIRLLIILPLLFLAAGKSSADDWETEWLTAIRGADLVAMNRLAAAGRNIGLAGRKGKTALMIAASKGDVALMRKLLALGSHPDQRNSSGGTALMYAAQYDRRAAAELLIDHGANADLQAAKGWTAMMIAVLKGHDRMVEMLLTHGAHAEIRDMQGFSPLMRAVAEGRAGIVARLLEAKRVDVNAFDERGITALHLAAANGHLEIARRLLDHGADPGLRDHNQNTARSLAEQGGHADLVALIDGYLRSITENR